MCAGAELRHARVLLRARIVLLAAEGKQDLEIARLLSIVPRNAARWRSRFLRDGIAGQEHDAPPLELCKNASSLVSKNIIANPNPLSGLQRRMTFSKRLNAPRPT
jgi:hypothetical protein